MKKLIAHYSFPRLKVGGVTLKKVIQLNYLFLRYKNRFRKLGDGGIQLSSFSQTICNGSWQ